MTVNASKKYCIMGEFTIPSPENIKGGIKSVENFKYGNYSFPDKRKY